MDMRFFWVGDKVAQEMYKLRWQPGQKNLANYQSKHHAMSHHINVRPWYLHMENSPRFLPRAQKPSALKGVLELSMMGTYVTYPYQVLHGYRAQVT
jgi:hypothetical protein